MSDCRLPREIKITVAPVVIPTLGEVLADMTLISGVARNMSSAGALSWLNYTSLSYTSYVLSICYGYMGIWKVKSSGVTTTPIITMATSSNKYGGIKDSGTGVTYLNDGYLSGSGTGDSVYGATFMIVYFPSYTEAQVDAVLGDLTLTRVAGRNNSSTGYVRTNSHKSCSYYLTTKYKTNGSSYTGSGTDPGLVIWSCNGTTWTKYNQVTPDWQAGTVSSGYLTLGSCYAGSIIGID